MTRRKDRPNRTRAAAIATALLLTLASGSASAGSLDGSQITVCGKWVLKLRQFGKQKIRDYNSWVPPNFQTTPDRIQPSMTFNFGGLGPDTWFTQVVFPDQQGVEQTFTLAGSYEQRGNRLKFDVAAAGLDAMEASFEQMAKHQLFGARDLVAEYSFARVRNANRLRFKGRIKNGGDRLKVKFKANMLYDVQYQNLSEYPDIFDAKGKMKLRMDTKHCD